MLKFLLIYSAVISFIGIAVTVYDKVAAKALPKNRTPEATLIWIGILGGSAAMFFTMLMIRHKTKHPKFMIGLPVIIFAQAALILGAMYMFGA